ncbi:MAG TPA: efflux RND transporter periplasmic adaptor subunit [Chthoniobacter sp.]|jgi:multidrug efflux system membrane fusion protein
MANQTELLRGTPHANPALHSPTHSPSRLVEQTPPPRKGKGMVWIVLAVLVIAGIYWWTGRSGANKAAAGAAAGKGGPVPVVPGVVEKKDVPIYLDGLGTVQALNTVTVHTRVDGQLTKVAFTEGQDVKTGDVLAIIDQAPFQAALAQAEGRLAQDQAQLANAKLDLQRYMDLVNKKVISSQQYDTQKALVAQFEGTIQNDSAAVESAKVNLNYTTVVSPLDGRIGIRLVDQGNIVHASDQGGLLVITQLHPISLIFTLPEQNLAQIHEHTAKGETLQVLAVDRDSNTTLDRGELSVIDNQIDTTTGTIRLKATFDNGQYQLWPGQFINARLHVATRKDGLTVPASTVQRGPNGPYVFVIKDDQSVELRNVKVAQIDDGEALIDEGLAEGEKVVVDGQYKLQPGSKVVINPQAAAGAKAHAAHEAPAQGSGGEGHKPGNELK